MLKERLSPADEAARERDMRDALAACPRILDLIARGPLADPDADAIIYLRSLLDPHPVRLSNDHLMGSIKAAETFFRAQGIGRNDAIAILAPTCPATIAAIFGAAACGIAEPLNLLFTREAIIAQLNAVEAKLLLAPPPGLPGGLYEKIEGLQKDVPSLKRIVIVPLDGTVALDGDVLAPDSAWREDYGKCNDTSEADHVAVMLPTGGTTGHPKVARLSNRAMVASCVSSRMALDYRKGDRAMIPLPLFHVGGLFVGVGASLSAGTTFVIPGPAGARDPAFITQYLKIIETHGITHGGGVPTTLGALADVPVGGHDISSLRVSGCGASVGKIFKPKLREIAAGEAARELLLAEGLAEDVSVEAVTDPSRGLYLRVTAKPDRAAIAKQILQRLDMKRQQGLIGGGAGARQRQGRTR